MSTECYVERAHPQHVDIIAIHKIACREDDHLETDVCSASSGMDSIDHHEVLRGPSVGIVPILMQYYVSFSMALIYN
jgi:hypothetical protein